MQLTQGLIFNGIPDWVYEGKYLSIFYDIISFIDSLLIVQVIKSSYGRNY